MLSLHFLARRGEIKIRRQRTNERQRFKAGLHVRGDSLYCLIRDPVLAAGGTCDVVESSSGIDYTLDGGGGPWASQNVVHPTYSDMATSRTGLRVLRLPLVRV